MTMYYFKRGILTIFGFTTSASFGSVDQEYFSFVVDE